jgi:hypothetical protein
MSNEPVPEDVREFILRYINSIAQLEALLLLWRDSNATWDVAAMAKRLYIGERETSDVLAQMNADGLATASDGGYRFNADCSDDQRQLVGRLAQVYAKQLISVTNIIHAKPRRIREFADAFKIRKDH